MIHPAPSRPMKVSIQDGWRAAATAMTMLLLAVLPNAHAQQPVPDTGWNSRMAALQEEHDAQAGVAVSIVFDDSGSMNKHSKLVMAKQAFRAWIEHAPDSYRFGLAALNAGVLVPLQRNDRAQILAAVNRLQAAGDTPLADTIAKVAADIRQRRAAGSVYERQVVVVLTDGEDNTQRGIEGVKEEIRKLCANGVEVIAFGYQGEGDYMRDSATHFYSPENGRDISKGLDAIGSEIGDTSDVVVDDATRSAMRTVSASVAPQNVPTPEAATPPRSGNVPFSPNVTPTASPKTAASHASQKSSHGWLFAVIIMAALLFRPRRKGK